MKRTIRKRNIELTNNHRLLVDGKAITQRPLRPLVKPPVASLYFRPTDPLTLYDDFRAALARVKVQAQPRNEIGGIFLGGLPQAGADDAAFNAQFKDCIRLAAEAVPGNLSVSIGPRRIIAFGAFPAWEFVDLVCCYEDEDIYGDSAVMEAVRSLWDKMYLVGHVSRGQVARQVGRLFGLRDAGVRSVHGVPKPKMPDDGTWMEVADALIDYAKAGGSFQYKCMDHTLEPAIKLFHARPQEGQDLHQWKCNSQAQFDAALHFLAELHDRMAAIEEQRAHMTLPNGKVVYRSRRPSLTDRLTPSTAVRLKINQSICKACDENDGFDSPDHTAINIFSRCAACSCPRGLVNMVAANCPLGKFRK